MYIKKTSRMADRKGNIYTYRGTRGSGLVCSQKVPELGLNTGDQFMALADETTDKDGNLVIKTSMGLLPVKYFYEK